MTPINADNPRELERFTNIVERTVVSLKENNKFANLEGETIIVCNCAGKTWNRQCGIDVYKNRHHQLLHEEKVATGSMEGKADTPVTEENKSSTYETVQEHAQRSIALCTVPVILKHGERSLEVNCFLAVIRHK